MNKKLLTETDVLTKINTSAIKNSGWDNMKQVREELHFTDGRQYSSMNRYGKSVSQGKLNPSLIRGFIVSLPSLAEQKAIVEKVHALMALCDTVEKEIETHQTTQ
jgi:hypothetical protein